MLDEPKAHAQAYLGYLIYRPLEQRKSLWHNFQKESPDRACGQPYPDSSSEPQAWQGRNSGCRKGGRDRHKKIATASTH